MEVEFPLAYTARKAEGFSSRDFGLWNLRLRSNREEIEVRAESRLLVLFSHGRSFNYQRDFLAR